MWLMQQRLQTFQHLRTHAEPLQLQPVGRFVEQAQHNALAVAGGQGGNTHVDRTSGDPQGNPAILWQALVMDLGLVVFFLCYTFVFNWAFDQVFGLPASAAATPAAKASPPAAPGRSSSSRPASSGT